MYHVYKQLDLDSLNENGIISCDVYIHGGENISLRNIRRIKGYLGFANVSEIDLCDIEEIDGDLWVSTFDYIPECVELSELKVVRGSVNLNYTPVRSLGKLEIVGSDLCIRDTDIEDLNSLSFIGGNLLLPYKFKNNIDLSNIEIKGEVKYYRLSKDKVAQRENQKGLTPSKKRIPIINAKNTPDLSCSYIMHLSDASDEQKEFFYYFKECFDNGILIDVKGFYEYPMFLVDCLVNDKSKPLSEWLSDYDRLVKAYPQIDSYAPHEFRWLGGRFDVGWELAKRKTYLDFSEIGYYEERLSKALFDVNLLLRISGAVELSPWGRQHIKEITPFIQAQFEAFEKRWGRHFLQVFVDETLNPNKDYNFYKQFFVTDEDFDFYNSIEYGKYLPNNYDKLLPNLVEGAIKQQCKKFTIAAEDSYRESIGMPKIGEFWKSETELYYSIKNAFRNTEVKQHASPKWLGLQHLDVYIPEFNIGIEYQGAQHYHPVEFFGGEEAFKKGQERDARKRMLCKNNDCELIYVDEGYDLNEVIAKIEQIMEERRT